MSFNEALRIVLQAEGGYANNPADRGGETNFGISSRANPDLNVRSLTREQAADIYKKRYWDAIGGDSLPRNTALVAFDAAVNHGPSVARDLLRRTGGDPGAMIAERRKLYSSIVQNDSSQRQFQGGWENRMRNLEGGLSSEGSVRLGEAVNNNPFQRASETSAKLGDPVDGNPFVRTPQPQEQQQTPGRPTSQELVRAAGRTIRAGIKGIASPATMVGDALGLDSSGALNRTLDQFGLPGPENKTEQFAENVAGAITGAGGFSSAGRVLAQAPSAVTAGVGRVLAASPGMQVLSAATGSGSSELAREAGAGPVGQIAAGLAGAMAPAAVQATGAATVRGAVRGGEAGRQTMENRIQTFEDAGVSAPTVGQASGSRRTQAMEAGLTRMPGSSGVMHQSAEQTAQQMRQRVDDIATAIKPVATPTKAGRTIETGIKNFVDRFRGEQNFMYSRLDKFLPAQSPVDVTNFRSALQQANASAQGAENILSTFRTPKMEQAFNSLMKDSGGGPLSWEAVKQLRSAIGEKISNAGLNPDISRNELKRLYAALSADMRDAAYRAGPQAELAFNRANAFSAAGYNRIDTFLERVAGKDTMEKIFQAAVNTSEIKAGGSTINAVMRSLQPAERDIVKAAFIKRLGEAGPGVQDAAGEVFSPRTFLTNLNKVSDEARRVLFSGGTTARDLATVANAAEMVDKATRAFSNPSGTAQAAAQQALGGGVLVALGTGQIKTAAALLSAPVVANLNARLMTNPNFVSWLARSTRVNLGALPSQLNALAQMKVDPQTKADMQKYSESVREAIDERYREANTVPQ